MFDFCLQRSLFCSIMASIKQLTVHLVDCLKNPAVLRAETGTVERGKALIRAIFR